MATTKNNNQQINETLLNDSKIVVGKWNERVKIENSRKNRQFKSDLRVDGLWYLIGKLMNDFTEVHGSVSEDLAKKYGFDRVASRQRRHEAKVVYQNYELATKILRKSKRGINSISYLFQQLEAEINPKTVSKDTVTESKVGQKEEDSNQVESVGTITVNKEQLTEQILADQVALQIVENNLNTSEFATILKANLELLQSA